MTSIAKFFIGLYLVQIGLFFLLCLIAVIKGMVISWNGNSLNDILTFSIGPVLIPMFFLSIHFVFCAFFPNWLRFLSTVFVMPWILAFTALVTIPSSGDVPPKCVSSMSDVEKIDYFKSGVQYYLDKAKSDPDPNAPHADFMARWERGNHNPDGSRRKFESRLAEYDKKKADLIEKKRRTEESKPTRLKILDWILPG